MEIIMKKNELRELQFFLKNAGTDSVHFIDDIGVFEGIMSWAKEKYREQGPNKLGKEYIEL